MLIPTGARRIAAWALTASVAATIPGCALTDIATLDLPERNVVVCEQLVVYSDFPLPKHHRLLEELTALRNDLAIKLDIPTSDEPVHVYLFDTAREFDAFRRQRFPELSARRAFFVETDTRLAVYAHWGDRVAEDLRHEVAHGYLHSVVARIPLWLDEGLAEYFEVYRGGNGVNGAHLADLNLYLGGAWQADLERLESLTDVEELTQEDYAESWAWVHWLLETPERRQTLRGYLQAVRRDGDAAPLSRVLRQQVPTPELSLAEHVRRLAAGK